jgi:uncharacterized membrane-anchored protein
MKRAALLPICFVLISLCAFGADEKPKFNVVHGPADAPLGSIAIQKMPEGYVFLDGKDTRTLLEAAGEPTSGEELGMLRSTNADFSIFYEFSETGYVKDDEKNKLNPDKLLASIKKGNDSANKARVKAGNPPLEIVGWEVPPRYDEKTHNLEWAIRATSEGEPLLNYNTRLLGRKGVMEVVLVVTPDKLGETLPEFRELLKDFSYQSGQSYAEFRSGDKVAKYGLGALVVGGAAVGAAKLGLFAWLAVFLKKGWKLVVVAVVGIGAAVRKLFSGRSQSSE